MKRVLTFFAAICGIITAFAQTYPYQDASLSPDERATDLLGRLSVEQKIMLMDYNSPEIPELGIRKYNWWNEALHGSARNGLATVFPQSIGMAASWNVSVASKMTYYGNAKLVNVSDNSNIVKGF